MAVHLAECPGIRSQRLHIPGDEEASLPGLHALERLEQIVQFTDDSVTVLFPQLGLPRGRHGPI